MTFFYIKKTYSDDIIKNEIIKSLKNESVISLLTDDRRIKNYNNLVDLFGDTNSKKIEIDKLSLAEFFI